MLKKVNFLLPNFGMKPVGGFKIAYMYANYLQRQGYDVHIVYAHSMWEDDTVCDYIKDRVKIRAQKTDWFKLYPGIKQHYCYRLNENTVPSADISIATFWKTAVVLNRLSKAKGKKIYLIQGYETWNGYKKEVNATWCYDMKKIVISKWLCQIGKNLNAQNITYIPNSINFQKYCIKEDVKSRENIVAMLYSNQPCKASSKGIAVLKKVRKEIPDLKVFFFGVDSREKCIPSWIEYYENAQQNVIVDEIYNKAAVYLCTSIHEGWGLPPMEAMACGCALVTTQNGGVEDFAIDNKTAILCEINNIDQMAEGVVKLLRDRELRYNMAIAGYRKVREFRWKDSFQLFEKSISEE